MWDLQLDTMGIFSVLSSSIVNDLVLSAIASSLGLDTEDFVAAYKSWGMYLDDLSCCGQECLTC